MHTLLPVVQTSAELVGIKRHHRESTAEFDNVIDVSKCMELLHLTVLGCINDREHLKHFWTCLKWDFMLMMLGNNQALNDIELMIHILSTSVLGNTLTSVLSGEDDQAKIEGYAIERATYLLFEGPTLGPQGQRYDVFEMYRLRTKILQLLRSFCLSPHGSEALATHPLAIGRLVRLISREVDLLYDYRSTHEQR